MSAAAVAAVLLVSAGKHINDPGLFVRLVPEVLCRDDSGIRTNGPLAVLSREEWVAVSGLLQAGAAVGLLIPATRRAAAGCVAGAAALVAAGHLVALRRDRPSGSEDQPR